MLWRRFLVRSDSTLADLHVVLQISFDWTDFHLHRFRIRKKDYAVPRLGGLACHDGVIIESCGWGDEKKRILSVIKKKPAGLTRGRQKERMR